ncbi:trichome birefringence-like 12-like protein [Drosera capensis]
MRKINSWKWKPFGCELGRIDPGDGGGRKWKRKGASRGGFFPRFNVTVGYHRAVLLAKYEISCSGRASNRWFQSNQSDQNGLKGFNRVDVDIPAADWADITDFYDVLVFTLVIVSEAFFLAGIGIKVAVACLIILLKKHSNNGVNKEARQINNLIQEAVRGTNIRLLDLTHLSEYRVDAHPSIWLGKQDAVAIWGQDCMHWYLPGVPDTRVDILTESIRRHFAGG